MFPATQIYSWRYGEFADAIRVLLERWPASVTSWWRTPAHNATLGGHANDSEHLVGLAVDLVFDPGHAPDPGELIVWCRAHGLLAQDVTPATAAPPAPGQAPERSHWHVQWAG